MRKANLHSIIFQLLSHIFTFISDFPFNMQWKKVLVIKSAKLLGRKNVNEPYILCEMPGNFKKILRKHPDIRINF